MQSLERLGRLEEGNVSEAFSQMSSRAAELVAARRKGCEALAAKFEAPLKEAVSVLLGIRLNSNPSNQRGAARRVDCDTPAARLEAPLKEALSVRVLTNLWACCSRLRTVNMPCQLQ